MYAVAGVTGNTGKVVAERLLAAGAQVRVLVRDAAQGAPWAARGAEVAVTNLDDVASLTGALRGVRGAWLLLPPTPGAEDVGAVQDARAANIAAAVREAGVDHLVFLSSIAAHLPAGTGPIAGLHRAEGVLAGASPQVTFVRAAYFLENWASALGGLGDGVFATFVDPDARFDMVATADIGAAAADALLTGTTGVIELASGLPRTPREIAGTLGELVGRDLHVVGLDVDGMAGALQGFGIGADMARMYEEMTRTLNAGGLGWEGSVPVTRGATSPGTVLAGLLGGA